MIGNMAVRITADRPNFPLGTLFVRAGSAANIALVGVPVRPGVNVTALALRVENVDGATADYAARAIGGVWVVDVPAAHFATVGSVTGGVSVWATGTGADGETSRTWCVGVGDLEVLTADADAPAPAPGQTFWPLRMFDAAPASPTKYNAYIDGAALKIWNGTAWVEISGGSIDVADAVTRAGANPVKSSGIWSAIWGALKDIPRAFTSLYDYCMGWFIDAESIAPSWDSGASVYHIGDFCVESRMNGASGLLYRCKMEYTPNSESHGPRLDTEHWEPVDVTALIAEKQNALSAAQLANIAAVTDKADAADLRYRIADANSAQTGWSVPDNFFPVGFTFNGTAYSIPLSSKDDVSLRLSTGDAWYLTCLADGVSVDVSVFNNNGVFSSESLDVEGTLTFNNARPVVGTTSLGPVYGYIVADRTVNIISTYNQTSIDIGLPDAVTVDGVRYARDFILDIDNSANASDLALEFTGLDVNYAFVPLEDDSISEMMTIGAGERVRLYFTETPYAVTGSLPVINVARVTLGDFVTSTTTQGGN